MVSILATGCKKTSEPVLSYEDGLKAACFELDGLLDKEGKCVLPTQATVPVLQPVPESEQPNNPITLNQTFMIGAKEEEISEATNQEETILEETTPEDAIPKMLWYESNESTKPDRSYSPVWVENRFEWWMDGYRPVEGGKTEIIIEGFSQFTFNSVVGTITVVDRKGEIVATLPNGNHFLDNNWFEVQEGFYAVVSEYTAGNPSNGNVTFARP